MVPRQRPATVNILVVDDHHLLRDLIELYLARSMPDAQVRTAGDLNAALELVQSPPTPDVILLDLKLAGPDGIEGLRRMKRARPESRVVMISSLVSQQDVRSAMAAGADGFISTKLKPSALVKALELVADGERFVSWSVVAGDEPPLALDAGGQSSPLDHFGLTRGEQEVYGLLLQGKTNKEIARHLGLQEVTIKLRLRSIYRKLNVKNRMQAVRLTHVLELPT